MWAPLPTLFASVEIYDAATGAWTAFSNLRIARLNHAAVLLANGKLLVIGGQGTGASTSAEIGSIADTPSLAHFRSLNQFRTTVTGICTESVGVSATMNRNRCPSRLTAH